LEKGKDQPGCRQRERISLYVGKGKGSACVLEEGKDQPVCWNRERISLCVGKGKLPASVVEEGIAPVIEEGKMDVSMEGISSCVKESLVIFM